MTIENYHYVYRITNVETKTHYYGKRTSKIEPNLDLGINYFSSSSNKEFKLDQINNPHNYKYKIVQKFKTSKDAIFRESILHNRFNVGINPNFYNRTKQTPKGFDFSGIVRSAETRKKLSLLATGRACHINTRNAASRTHKNKPKSPEQKLKMSTARRGKKGNRGIEKMATLKRGIPIKDETKANYTGKNNKDFLGYYILPDTITDTRKELNQLSISQMWCKNSTNIINKYSYGQSTYLKTNYSWGEVEGKTFEELGFGFIPKELFLPIICVLFILQPT